MISDFFSLIFPRSCAACAEPLMRHETSLCTFCLFGLPRTDDYLYEDNPVARRFWGRIRLHAAAAFLTFEKDGKVQQLLHSIKYQGRSDAAVMAGKLFGAALRDAPRFSDVDFVIPVPLHSAKLRQRGYNQAEVFAKGIAGSMGVQLDTGTLQRLAATETQTRKNRFERWKNVEEVFGLGPSGHFEGKHLLLVDDVVTTGATLEACAQCLAGIPGVRISLAALASAKS